MNRCLCLGCCEVRQCFVLPLAVSTSVFKSAGSEVDALWGCFRVYKANSGPVRKSGEEAALVSLRPFSSKQAALHAANALED